MKRLVLLASIIACGPKPAPVEVATLPTDGTAHTAKPTGPAKPVDKDAWTGRTDLISAPPAPAPTALALPPVTDFKLANGLQVYVVKNDRLPTVSFALAMKAGRNAEPRARLGVSEATADMLVKGTKKHDAIGLAKAIDFVGGTIGADSTFEATLVTCSVLTRNRNTCLDLVPEMITQSTFPDAELSKVKDNMVLSVRGRLDNAEQLASAHVQNLLWGPEHVRGWVNSEATINALKRDELVQWAKTWYVPNNAILVVAGDVDDKAIKGEIERAFGGWKKQDLPPVPTFKDPTLSGIRIRLVDKPGQTQTHIRIAQYGIKHDDARFFDTLVWNYALGGGTFGSRLMKTVRVQGGKTYGASSAFDRNLDKGSFVAQTFTRNSEALATTKLLLGELGKMQKEGPTADEVQAAVANIAGGYALRFQSANDFGSALVGAELHNFGTEYLTQYPVQVGKVDADAAKRAAAEILDTRNYVLVWVGDAKDLEPQLKKEGWRYEKVAFTDPLSDVKEEAPAPLQGPQALAAAKQALADALKVKGGAKVTAIKELHMLATGTTVIQGQTFPVEISREFVLPDKMRIDANIAKKMMVTVVVDGDKGWESAPGQNNAPTMMDLQGNDMAAAQFEQWREAELILVKANDPAAKLTPLADDKIDGKDQTVVQLQSPFKLAVTIFIDKKTKLITRMTYSDSGQTETDDFGDYRDTNGIKVAFKRNSTTSGRATSLTIDKVELNRTVKPDFFAKPAEAAAPAPAPKP
ncbi:MAG: pitrilysin family protein [Kofleriaceae bacterium]